MLSLVYIVAITANAAPVPFGSGTALHFNGNSLASMPVSINGSFHLSFWLRRNWLSGSETIFSLAKAEDVLLLFRSTSSGADAELLLFLLNEPEINVDPKQQIHTLDPTEFVHCAFSYGEMAPNAQVRLAFNGNVVFEQETISLALTTQHKVMTLYWGAATAGSGNFKYFSTADLDDVRLWSIGPTNVPPISHLQPVHDSLPTLLTYHDFDLPVHRDFKLTSLLQARVGVNGTCRDSRGDSVPCTFIPSTIMAPLGGRMIVQGKPSGKININLHAPHAALIRIMQPPAEGLLLNQHGILPHTKNLDTSNTGGIARLQYTVPSESASPALLQLLRRQRADAHNHTEAALRFDSFTYVAVGANGVKSESREVIILVKQNSPPLAGHAYALQLDGKTAWVELTQFPEINSDMTVELWADVRSVDPLNGQGVVGKHSPSGGNVFLMYFTDTFVLRVHKAMVHPGQVLQVGPQHLALTVASLNCSHSRVAFYRNGVLLKSEVIDQVWQPPPSHLCYAERVCCRSSNTQEDKTGA